MVQSLQNNGAISPRNVVQTVHGAISLDAVKNNVVMQCAYNVGRLRCICKLYNVATTLRKTHK